MQHSANEAHNSQSKFTHSWWSICEIKSVFVLKISFLEHKAQIAYLPSNQPTILGATTEINQFVGVEIAQLQAIKFGLRGTRRDNTYQIVGFIFLYTHTYECVIKNKKRCAALSGAFYTFAYKNVQGKNTVWKIDCTWFNSFTNGTRKSAICAVKNTINHIFFVQTHLTICVYINFNQNIFFPTMLLITVEFTA